MFPRHVFPDTTRVNREGHLVIGGCDTTTLASRFGTPLYIYDEETLRARCRTFVKEFRQRHPNSTVVYASKAYINPALAQIFAEEGLGLDVVSGGELTVAQAVDFPRERVYFHGNNKGRPELEQAMAWGIGRVVIDSFYELGLLEEVASQTKRSQEVLLRVSPGIDPHTHAKTTTGILDSKFGFSIGTGDATRAVKQAIKAPHLKLMGLHFHLGSPIFELEPYRAAMELVLDFASGLREEGLILGELSPGGGFAIAYTRQQRPPSIADYAETLVSSLTEGCQRLGMKLPRLVIEPGRAIAGPAGVALYRVGAVKDIPGVRRYVSVDGGMGDNIRPALYEAVYEAVVANRMNAEPTDKVTIAGKYCESGDVLVRDVLLPPIQGGGEDLIALPAAGAYCPSMASNYNLNPRPPIVLVRDGQTKVIRRRETYQDQMLLDVVQAASP
jgi:diaminopimelate decarboxylase